MASTNTIIVPKGKSIKIELEDKTVVHINNNSTLILPSSFANDSVRLVKLVGEAFFDVSHNPKKRFIVQAQDVDIKVYGTKFNVNTCKKIL